MTSVFLQNCRGLQTLAKKQEAVHIAKRSGNDVFAGTETWIAQEIFPNKRWATELVDGYHFIYNGTDERVMKKNQKSLGRHTGGVCFGLSPRAYDGFLAAGEQIYRFGERILAIRVELEVSSGRSKLNSKIVKEEQHFRREW